MLDQLLPGRVDNTYRGYRLALWLFGLVVLMKIAQSLNCIFNGYTTATGADAIPLDTFSPPAAQTVLSLFALMGLSRLMLGLLGILVLVRYRALIPLMFGLLALEYLSGRLILQFVPIARTGTPVGFYVNGALFAMTVVGLALSLRSQGNHRGQE